jgi:hypothetical protein
MSFSSNEWRTTFIITTNISFVAHLYSPQDLNLNTPLVQAGRAAIIIVLDCIQLSNPDGVTLRTT